MEAQDLSDQSGGETDLGDEAGKKQGLREYTRGN